MNKKAKQNVEMKLPDAKTESGDSGASPEMSAAAAATIYILADIAKHSSNLFRIYAERLKSDDGYQVMDPRTVASTFGSQAAVRTLVRFGAALAKNSDPYSVKHAG